jgi:long-chain acyl-CoA synthetase
VLRKLGSIGTPIDGVRMRVVDEHGTEVTTGTLGDIQVRGYNLMKGYWDSPEATADAFADRTSTRGQALCPNRLRFNER